MPEITAEQLAARKHHSITVLGEQCYIWAVTQAEHDLILAALREHEERAAVRDALVLLYDKYENGDPCYEDPSELEGYMGSAVQLSDEEERSVLLALESLGIETAIHWQAEAAVEKAVTSSLVRCDCVDANGNTWPDCTCDHGWRQAAVEKAVRNG